MSMDIRAMFSAKKAREPVQGERDPITLFKNSVRTQIKKVEELQKDPLTKIAQTNWFKAYDGGYRLQLGKTPLELDGAKFWQVDNLDEARALLEGALELADSDKEFQEAIRAAKKPKEAEATKPKRGRKPKAA
ncbi:putative NAD-dependent protein-ADP-ribosyltransferase YbiA (DUF1768 family) [Mycoplana sp. BE70]|uniref:hypothetical protein n=1 Tax=Mycoplana sp. BE70 TaxID=2817775 RepID=UPI00285C5A26|nr:hypothetical protein [Mycoplana sp. BE70]MDR6757204.1 putative NAD-dependent protein-ADP-ribosyltransferase YbiA (DUF1768 family) [Mycoplana sp. BE70]